MGTRPEHHVIHPARSLGGGSSEIWAAGDSGTILRWNGSIWGPVASGVSSTIYALWGSGPADIWVVGDGGTVLRWNGSSWRALSSGTTRSLFAIHGSAANDVWLTNGATTLHWDGSSLSSVPNIGDQFALYAVAPNDAWSLGYGGQIRHWDGSAWSSVASPTGASLRAITGRAWNDLWAAGDDGVVLHWDGTRWTTQASGVSDPLRGIVLDGTTLWVAGQGGLTLRRDPAP